MNSTIANASASKDRNFGLVGSITFHTLVILAIMFGFRSCELEGGGGGGNGGNGDGLMSLDIAGLGNDVDGWGASAAPAVPTEAPVEPVEQTPDVSDNSSDMVTTSPDTPTNTRPRNTTTQTQTQTQTQPQPSNALNNALNGLSSGSGNTSANGQQGNPNGQVDGRGVINGGGGSPGSGGGTGGGNGTGNGPGNGSGSGIGVGFSLNGRSWRQKPALNDAFNEDGKVVVNITVDKNGNVLTAAADPVASNTNSSRLYALAEKAAKQAKFNVMESGVVQRGTITIEFKLR